MSSYQEIDASLIRRYNTPGPRYTSYPTAIEFKGVDASVLEGRLKQLGDAGEASSLYVHLPFCDARCHYCACNVVIAPFREKVETSYLAALVAEAKLVRASAGKRVPIRQLHLGGGTPTYHGPEELDWLLSRLEEEFDIAPDAECSVEVDPRVTTDDQLRVLAGHGFRRISLGVQDTDPKVQEAIGRVQPLEETRRCIESARRNGFDSVNVDLIYGLPYQSPQTIAQTVEDVVGVGVDRLAVYSFAWVPKQRAHQHRMPTEALPSADEKVALLAALHRELAAAHYAPIGIDHFALETDELAVAQREGRLRRNFMGYTTLPGDDMIGIGLSSIGMVRGLYAQNTKKLKAYVDAINAGVLPVERGTALSEDDRIRATVIRELMCNFRVNKEAVEAEFGIAFNDYFEDSLSALQPFVDDGLVRDEPTWIVAEPVGRAFTRNLAMCFDAYRGANDAAFSRTV